VVLRQPFRLVISLTVMEAEARREVLAELYGCHYAELVRLGFAISGDWSLAEDIAQEAFVRAWRSWGRIQREQSAPAYLRAIVVNLARTSLRGRRREIRASWIAEDAHDAEVSASASADVLKALADLPPGKRSCVVLRHYLDMSEAETAALLGISVGTVKSQTAKALQRLRASLADSDTPPVPGIRR
jgi:RNA polymerase sigma-70 factor (sigma-E family)